METKVCNKCGEMKEISKFTFEKRTGNYSNICIECNKKYHKEYYLKRKKENNNILSFDLDEKKVCKKCNIEKALKDFSFDKSSGKFVNICKECKSKATKQYYERNKEKCIQYSQEYRNNHKEQLNEYFANYRKENAEKRREYSRQYEKNHIEEIKIKRKKYSEDHREERTKYYLNKRYEDPLFKLSTQVRGLIRISLKKNGYSKNTSTYEILGCDYETLMEHLKESWLNNYGSEWNGEPYHIDHIIPLATAKTEKEIIELCYYKNLQMLKPHDNLVKNKYIDDNKNYISKNNKE